jgi:hypothetical protein
MISCSGSERWSASSSLWVSLWRATMGVERRWKGTTTVGELIWCVTLPSEEKKIEICLIGGETDQCWDKFFIAVEGESRTIRGGWPIAVVWIQYFDFDSRGEPTGRSITGRWNRGSELILSSWEGSVTRHGDVVTSIGWEAAPGREKEGDGTIWPNTDFTGLKNKENICGRFCGTKWTMMI